MRKSIQLSIPKPCHENWAAMTPEAQGRFCQSCAKIVVDFTAMTDTQLVEYFSRAKEQQTCGRLAPDQLNTVVKAAPVVKKRQWFWRYAAAFFLFMGRSDAKAQTKPAVVKSPVCQDPSIRKGRVIVKPEIQKHEAITVKGTVRDESGMGIGYATVMIKGTATGVATDDKGFFTLKANKGDVLYVASVGYESKEVVVQSDSVTIVFEPRRMLMGEVVTVGAVVQTDELPVANDIPRHIIDILVTDKDGMPIPQTHISVRKTWKNKAKNYRGDKQGRCTIRRIREDEEYEVAVTADGYERKLVTIAGYQLQARKESKRIVLEKKALAAEQQRVLQDCITATAPAFK